MRLFFPENPRLPKQEIYTGRGNIDRFAQLHTFE
jgi:hypothetical protein